MSDTLTKVKGVVVELTGTKSGLTKKGKTWKKYDFLFKTLDGQTIKCNTFGSFDKELLNGDTVEFDAEYNEQYSNYSVKGAIEIVEGEALDDVTTDAEAEESIDDYDTKNAIKVTPKKRGRPKGALKVSPKVTVKKRSVETDLESVREAAEEVFSKDVASVHAILGNDATSQDRATFQAIRISLFIELNKRERVSNWNK